MDVEAVAREIYERLPQERDGRVLALWPDGELELVGFGFRGRRREDGSWYEPVASFPAKSPMAFSRVVEKLEAGLVRRGLLPPGPG